MSLWESRKYDLLYDYPKYAIVIGPIRVTWYVQIITFEQCSGQKYRSILPAADFWSERYAIFGTSIIYSALRNVDFESCRFVIKKVYKSFSFAICIP